MECLQYDDMSNVQMDPGENVLNLVISGMPSIPSLGFETQWSWSNGFKPYYNWNAFNTLVCKGGRGSAKSF